MYKDQILTLDNGLEYLVLNELDFNSRKFILGAMIDTRNDLIDEDDLFIKEVVSENGGPRVVSLEDEKELEAVSKLLLNKAAMEA